MIDQQSTNTALPMYEVVLWNKQSSQWENDWDGELHDTLEAAQASCAEARTAGYDAYVATLSIDLVRVREPEWISGHVCPPGSDQADV